MPSIINALQRPSGRAVPVYLQSEAAECGHTCLAMISTYHGHSINVAEMRVAYPPSMKGASLTQLMSIAKDLGLAPKAVKLDLPSLPDIPLPAVIHWDFNHFVVLARVSSDSVTIHDPGVGERTLSMAEFSKHFTGVALQLAPSDDFRPKKSSPTLRVRDLMGKVSGFGRAIGQVLFFALLLELIGLAMPMLTQVVADEVLPNAETSLLTVLGLGFLLLVLTRAGVGFLRDWALSLVSIGIKAQVAERVYRHALRLPPQYFERRRAVDISSRFDSLTAIERTLATTFIEAMLDGAFASIIVLVLFSYSPWLGVIVSAGVLAFVVVRMLAYQPMRELEMRIVEAHARQTGSLLETLRAIVPVQLANKTTWRMAQWGVHLAEGTNAELKSAKATAMMSAARSLTLGVTAVAFTWVAASMALDNTLTIGALFAVLAYQQTASTRLVSFVERLLSIRMLSVHLERLADIVYAVPQDKAAVIPLEAAEGYSIELKDVHFRYSPTEPEILKGINLKISAGEHVALTGASGCGKTTLMKLLLGILEPTQGEILLNGRNQREFGVQQQREITAAVLQDDVLFYGTVKDNISYFDPEASDEKVTQAAILAGIHQEILAMPLNYLSLVSEGSGALSGGQRQRLLLARAIYREPKLLMLDEATSHLDLQSEAVVNRGIGTLKATRVSIAHRPESLLSAERIVVLHGGAVVQEFTSAQFRAVLQSGGRAKPE